MNDDEVAIEMNFGELVSMWKQVTLNLFEDPDQYRVIIEMIGNQNAYITIFNLYELLNYRYAHMSVVYARMYVHKMPC